jgi:heme a synthase
MSLAALIRRLCLTGLLLCLVVVVLGAYVRLTAAGLGCPDWPGCYGAASPLGIAGNAAAQAHFPQTPVNVGKAWREMTHRYAAGTLGLIIIALTLLAATRRGRHMIGVRFACALMAILLLQASLGMLTVTLRLTPLVVTLHLLFGMTTLALLAWLWLSVRQYTADTELATTTQWPRRLALAALIILAMQIALGGWTSSNYAAIACADFPTCQGRFWPATDYAHAFVLWTGVGADYEGGLLTGPARVAIQLTHRLGACAVTLMLVLAAFVTLRQVALPAVRRAAWLVLAFLALQLVIAIGMVEMGFPLFLATAHNAGAALLLLATLSLYQGLRPQAAAPQGSLV